MPNCLSNFQVPESRDNIFSNDPIPESSTISYIEYVHSRLFYAWILYFESLENNLLFAQRSTYTMRTFVSTFTWLDFQY